MAIVIPISLLIYSNSRITEAKETLRAEIKTETATLRAEIRAEMVTLRAEMATLHSEIALLRKDMEAGFQRIESAIKIHMLEHHHQ